MKVLSVASEIYPLVKTGGLADVAGALPLALAREGFTVRSLIPGYPSVMEKIGNAQTLHREADLFGAEARVLRTEVAGLDLLVVDAPHLYGQGGNPYVDAAGRDWPDNWRRFAALGRIAGAIGQGLLPDFRPDIVHAHDWQAGLAPAYIRAAGNTRVRTVQTIHNLAFQGLFHPAIFGALGLPGAMMAMEGVEFYGQVGFLKAGLHFADAITTVSPTYAAEIMTHEGGMGLDGLLQARASVLTGICNGIDTQVWDPGADPHLPAPYDAARIAAKAASKTALRAAFALEQNTAGPLFGIVSRLTGQKGIDLIAEVIPELAASGAQLAVLGTGDRNLEVAFTQAAAAFPGTVGVRIGYDEALAHLIQGGSDALLVPSRFEPCGLTQLAALRYGTLPVVSRVGGLADTVIDANEAALAADAATGFQFAPVTTDALRHTLERVLRAWQDPDVWLRLQHSAMRSDVSWERPARQYAALYHGLVQG
ncbi:glycogen synthase GlgA [Bradyrhizobium prioriisuperbiae]|uniref:glycogen synthase GlgA n=1 Tax=Bradyrhizobium prioriisuperbiae TaxID=2854389 RepID=UPI0028E2DE21|nr:glycogen synthase GlgA [Bradyrhizobium prioritasuperba]